MLVPKTWSARRCHMIASQPSVLVAAALNVKAKSGPSVRTLG